jgi:dolichol-phosphate mannosyltransferase
MAVAPEQHPFDVVAVRPPDAASPTADLVRFAIVGASGYLVNLIAFAALERFVAAPHALAATGAFAVAVVNNYAWNRRWTFRARRGRVCRQAPRFLAVSLLGLLVNLAVLHLLVSLGLLPLLAQAVGVAVAVPITFFGSRVWSFPATGPERPLRGGGVLNLAVDAVDRRLAVEGERLARYVWVIRWWALSRVLVLAPALIVQAVAWPRASWYPSVLDRPLALLGAWDGRWYRMVAERGYFVVPSHQSDTAFFPLFPIALRALHAFGLSLTTGGLILANLGLLIGLVALYELARTWVPEAEARRTVVYASLFPAGFVFSMAYPESLVLAVMATAGLLAARGRWAAVGSFAALATLARPEGVFLTLPLAALAVGQWPRLGERARIWAASGVLAAPAALSALCFYDYRTAQDALAFSHAQLAWGRWTSADGVQRALTELVHASSLGRDWLYRDAVFCVLYLGCLALALRARVPRSWIAAGALIVLLPLWSGSFTSDARFGLLALPVYCGLAVAARRRWLDVTLRVASGAVLAASSATILLHWP